MYALSVPHCIPASTCTLHTCAALCVLCLCAGRYQYRWALQGNFFPGEVLRFSLVPPCLTTGANFGCSAFLGALYRMEVCGKLGREVIRLTDSGPDNDAKETHALHWQLIHDGVLQRLTWLSLPPKHSHNLADRYEPPPPSPLSVLSHLP